MNMRERLLDLLKGQDYRPANEAGLARLLGLQKKQRSALQHEIRLLLSNGEIVRVQGDRLRWNAPQADLTGKIQFKAAGFAFVRPDPDPSSNEEVEDVFIDADDTGVALPGDRVAVRLLAGHASRRRRDEDRKRSGKVLAVVERSVSQVVGTLQKDGRNRVLLPDDPRFPPLRLVEEAADMPNCAPGDKVVATLLPWKDKREPLQGRLERRLGRQFEPGAELLGVFQKFNLERHFPADVEREANGLPARVRPSELTGREDFREVPTVTIDPDDAKDFDDALSLETLEHGAVRVGIHIADVSAYVRPGTALDREARSRGNSTYLVGTVVPMLPERLSNGLCSLVEAEDRLTMAVLLTFDKAGRLKNTEYARTVIRSRKRLSYRQAQALLFKHDFDEIRALPALPSHQTGSTGRPLADLSDLELVDLQSMLRKLWAIAKQMRNLRMQQGSLDLDMPETKIFVDAKGYADRLVKMVHDESHQLIEEYMLAANEAVARLTRSQKLASLYRVHDEPDSRKLEEFRQFAATMGLRPGDLSRKQEMKEFLEAAERHPQSYLLKSQLLRSLRKACYRASPDGHYGLNKRDYTHFTSPIRRYADLVVHRVLGYHLAKQAGQPTVVPADRAASESLADHLSQTETNAQEAERESVKIKLLEFFERELEKKPQTRFRAVVTEIRNGGLFIELTESMTFGFVPADCLGNDAYHRNADGTALVGRRRQRRFQIGSTIDVVVDKVDRYRRLMDFALAE